jgi:hypothetical protein
MLPQNKQFGFGLLSFVILLTGLLYLVKSIIAFKSGGTVSFGGRGAIIQVSPWVGLLASSFCLTFAIVGLIKIWKDKDKFPPL